MRVAIKATLVAAIIVVGGVVLAAIIIGRPESGGGQRTEDKGQRTEDQILTSDFCFLSSETWWPMFRGGQRLLGRASGNLPDSIDLVWKSKTEGQIKSSPAIYDGLVFIGSSDANIYAIDLASGRQVWAYRTGDAVEASPCVIEETVFIGSSDNFLYALDVKTGKLRWKYKTGGQILGAANWTRSGGSVKTAGFGDGSSNISKEPNHPQASLEDATHQSLWILVGSYDNKLHCVDSANGDIVWTYETDSYINGSPAIEEGKAVFGGCDAMIHVVSLADGIKVTQIDSGSFIAASAAFFERRVYVGNYDGVFVCADLSSGKIVWKYTNEDGPFFSSPAVGNNVIVFGGRDKRVHCLRRDDGKLLWTFQTLGEVDSSPVICEDKVVVGSDDGRLYIIRVSDGSLIWSYEIGQAITSSPAVAKGMIVVGSDDGYLYAFGARAKP